MSVDLDNRILLEDKKDVSGMTRPDPRRPLDKSTRPRTVLHYEDKTKKSEVKGSERPKQKKTNVVSQVGNVKKEIIPTSHLCTYFPKNPYCFACEEGGFQSLAIYPLKEPDRVEPIDKEARDNDELPEDLTAVNDESDNEEGVLDFR